MRIALAKHLELSSTQGAGSALVVHLQRVGQGISCTPLVGALAKHLQLLRAPTSSLAVSKHLQLLSNRVKEEDLPELCPGNGCYSNDEDVASLVHSIKMTRQLEQARDLATRVLTNKFFLSNQVYLCNLMLLMFGRCGAVGDALKIFDKMEVKNSYTWNTMLKVYLDNKCWDAADRTFKAMDKECANPVSCICMLSMYSSQGQVANAKAAFDRIPDNKQDVFAWNALIGCYGRNGNAEQAKDAFDRMQSGRDVVSWNALLAGYVHSRRRHETDIIFGLMPAWDMITWNTVSSLTARDVLSVEDAKAAFDELPERDSWSWTMTLASCCRNGKLEEAEDMLHKAPAWNTALWNSVLAGYSRDGQINKALQLVQLMNLEGLEPNDVSFVCLLDGFSHVAKVKEGRDCFVSMVGDYGIQPLEKHYNCMVDLLGRAGKLGLAEELVAHMPYVPGVVTWSALLGACRNYRDTSRAERASRGAIELEPQSASSYVLLANTRSSQGEEAVQEVVEVMKRQCAKRNPGVSRVKVNGQVHEFVVADKSHPQSEAIYKELDRLTKLMKEAGYVPNREVTILSGGDDEKEELLCRHSEKLALAFAMISTPTGTSIEVTKNMRMCYDCHDATRFLSKAVGRSIVVRDANRIHRFKDGACSCNDHW